MTDKWQRRPLLIVGLCLCLGLTLLTGCAGSDGSSGMLAALSPSAMHDGDDKIAFGAYLSGRVSEGAADNREALSFYLDALQQIPDDPLVADRAIGVAVTQGRFDVAVPLARQLETEVRGAPLPELVLTVEALRDGHQDDALTHAQALPAIGFYKFSGALARAWARAASPDLGPGHPEIEAMALKELSGLEEIALAGPLRHIHAAMIEDLAGDPKAAALDYQSAIAMGSPPLRLVELAGNFYERAGLKDDARRLYTAFAQTDQGDYGFVPQVSATPPRPLIADPKAGLAEALFDMASLMNRAEAPQGTMISARLALRLVPDFALANIVLGDALATEGKTAEALAAYRSVGPDSPYQWAAHLSEAQILIADKNWSEASALLGRMVAERPGQAVALTMLGDAARQQGQFAEAAGWYGKGLDVLGPHGKPSLLQPLYFNRGIVHDRAGQWPLAETDLRRALDLKPDDAQLENYLGYALVQRGEHLREGLDLIQKAVAHAPEDGYIVDSLGWAYFHLGQFPKATAALERAIELKPADAEITSHLADAYWQTGRRAEARLEWRRALDLKPDPALAHQIMAKLDNPPARRREGVAAGPDPEFESAGSQNARMLGAN